MRYLNAADTRASLPMSVAIEAMELAFGGDSEAPMRSLVGGSLVMPGRVGDEIAVKIVSIVPGNPAGLVVVFAGDGSPMGVVDGPTLTAIRTGAGAGLATRVLAPEGASTLAMLGAGAMAFDQVEAVRAVRPIDRVLVWSRSFENAEALVSRLGGQAAAVASADEAVADADVVSCATPARAPLFNASSVTPTTHFNAVGAFTPEMAELPPELVRRGYVVVDDLEASASEAGDLIQAGRDPDTTLSDLLAGYQGPSPGVPTIFKSVGIAAQDVAAGVAALEAAERSDLGLVLS